MKAAGMHQRRPLLLFNTALAIGGVFALALVPELASAGDWSLDAKVAETFDFNDNYHLDNDPDGYVLGSISTVTADAIYKGDNYRFDLIGDLSYRNYFGPGDGNIADTYYPRLQAKFSEKGKTSALDLSASIARDETSTIDILDPLFSTIDTYRDSMNVSAGWSKSLDLRTTAGLSASLQKIVYEDSASSFTPSTSANIDAFWSKRLTKRTDLKTTAGVSWLSLDNDENTERKTIKLRSDLTTQLTPRIKLRAGGGARLILSTENDVVPPLNGDIHATDLGWLADVRVDYVYKLGTISAFASRSTDPSALGDLQNRWNFGVLATRKINEVSDVALSVQYRIAETGSETTKVLAISPTYSYRLTDEWNLQTGYRFLLSHDDGGSAHSNNVFVTLSRAWTPGP